MIEITFLGRGGQGAFTSSRILGAAVSLYENKYALSFPSFGPERRGAPVFAYTKIDNKPIRDRSQSELSDYFVILDDSLYTDKLLTKLKPNGKIILNTSQNIESENIIGFNANNAAEQFLGAPISNTAMLAVLVANTKIVSRENLLSAIDYDMPQRLAVKNKTLVENIFEAIEGVKI
ncbi:2-oxoacid:acceptor oxidoreductase family protein [Ruminiclostridium herbifermentans]|uniref:2-oxoacid:acceptor oxidoreductase family protein n=1 Tax=Ruminiclostridium herbifermentans TaxID=2488810 RepID=A0A4U7JKH3_9FIRM|nr:2-oxoacid:acceptor oxidoreductase family protein [Ruminiclostridium herbifermentans]QNU68636.1 2-oxoacid:acceptor oxidoreductase family protein [Ruminiclostridium herbifermentans]